MGRGKDSTECVICGGQGVATRMVPKVGYVAWVCRRHRRKDVNP